ncbi:MAG TPA: cysteine desulfurase [Nanoarchaeota archaeon]|nr:cysteine desulfurase [Nanoarchaeota archaeon]
MKVYLDNAATTPIDKEVLEAMLPYLTEKFGNASSLHAWGREAREAVEKAREIIAKKLNVTSNEVIFTSGGTESNNFALKGIAFANKDKGKHIITQKTEHPCVLETCKWLESIGFEVTYLDVDKYGMVSPEDVEKAIKKETILVSIMHANNEIGTIQPIEEIAKICKDYGVYFHTDACQSFTKEPLDAKKIGVDLITISSHKIYGPKGVGALIVREGVKIAPIMHGGGHEFGKRSGTENVAGIVGFGKAVEIAKEEHAKHMRKLRDIIIKRVLEEIPKVRLNGHPEKRLCNNANFTFYGIEGEALVMRLDARGIACSTGSACSSHKLQPSHVLLAIGLKPEEAHGSLRFSTGKQNTEEQINYAIDVLKEEVENLRKISGIV